MEVVDIQQPCKFPRIRNGRNVSNMMGDEEEDGEREIATVTDGGLNRLRGWNHSRIIRVSRASGGKDRHSKVLTSKGLRDRRVRLSVATAIQFYDLQDRLGYDQPSKAVEWLIKAASDSITELPSLSSPFPETPKQFIDEKTNSAEVGLDGELNFNQSHSQHLSLSKSACSSTSDTSKGSGLSLSRSEIRVNREKARERARERAAKDKEREHNVNSITQNASFTELLTSGIGSVNTTTSPLDYFASPSSSRTNHSSGFSGQIHFGHSLQIPPFYVISGDNNHADLQQFCVPDNPFPAAGTQQGGAGDYNLNSTISSSGLAGFNRGTLQSNLPHFQRFSPVEGANVPFFIGAAVSGSSVMENYHQNHHQFSDGRLQLCYDDGTRLSDQKGKGKN